MRITTEMARVKKLLAENPHLRDDDLKLVANIWYSDLKKMGKLDVNAVQFLAMYSSNKFSNAQSIRRMRRKLQEEFPELRGEKWEERHGEAEVVKKELRETPELFQGGTP